MRAVGMMLPGKQPVRTAGVVITPEVKTGAVQVFAAISRIAKRAVIRRSDDVIRTAQPKREIAVAFRSRRKRSLSRGGETADVFPFGSAKEEELVFDDRPAKTESEVVETQAKAGRHCSRLLKIVVRIEFVVPQEFKDATEKLVLAAARHDVDRRARIAAKLGREVRRLDVDFTNKVDPDIVDLAGIASGIEVRASVNRQIVRNDRDFR